jgi:hypothetical protein
MRVTSRKMSLFAAGVVAALSIATSAMAAEIAPPGKPGMGIASVKTASAPSRHRHHWPRYRVASWYTAHLRYADVAPPAWHSYYSSRPVLLMVGIAY